MGESQARREEGFEVDDPANGVPGGPPPPPPPDAAGSGSAAPPPPPATPDTGPQPTSWGSTPGWAADDPASQQWGAASPSAPVGWERPAGGSNGCLKGCLIVGGLLVVLVVIAGIALAVVGGRLAQQIADNPDAVFGPACPFVTAGEVGEALGSDVQVFSLEGLADGTMGSVLDKRLLRDAPDCYVLSQAGTTGRIAVLEGGGAAAFAAARGDAERFILRDTNELGDEALCTKVDAAGSGGALVRFGERVVYVSMLEQGQDADEACALSLAVAATLER